MKKTFLALALLAGASTAFAQTAPKKASGARADGCAGMAAAKCDKSMMSASASMADMPACCRARMAAARAAKATPAATASAARPVVKSL